MKTDPLEVPQPKLNDVGHIAVSTIMGLIPFAGAAELFKATVPPPIEKRLDNWRQAVASAIKEIQNRKSIEIGDLYNNDEFITLLIQTSQAAIKTHLEVKHTLLKQALVNAMSINANFDVKQLYISMVERFSPTHIAILSIVNRTKQHTINISSGNIYYNKLRELNETVTLSVNGIAFLGFLEDLHKSGLLVISEDFIISDGDVHQVATRVVHKENRSSLQKINLTDLGYGFLSFVDA